MRHSIMLTVGAFGTIFRTGQRHPGRHRCGSSSSSETPRGPDQPDARQAAVVHRGPGTRSRRPLRTPNVLLPKVPALPNGLRSEPEALFWSIVDVKVISG